MDHARTPNLSPTYAELAARYRSKARSLRSQAARYGDTPKGRAALVDAASAERMARSAEQSQAEIVAARNGYLTEFRKAQANADARYDVRLDPCSPHFDLATWMEAPCV